MKQLNPLGEAIRFIFAGLLDTIKQNRVIQARERSAKHNLRLAIIQAQIRQVSQ